MYLYRRRAPDRRATYDAPMRRLLDAIFWMLLAAWLALAVSGGIAAAGAFPTARGLALSLEGYEAFIEVKPEEGRLLVAGHLAEAIFALTGRLALLVAPAVLIVLAIRLLADRGRGLLPHAIAAALATAALLYGQFGATPRFREDDRLYRAAARSGDVTGAMALKEKVDAAHAHASRVASTEAASVLALIAISGFFARPSEDDARRRRRSGRG